MSRKRHHTTRKVLPDPKFQSELVTKFINTMMLSGKRSVSESIFYGALETIGERQQQNEPLDVFQNAIDNVRPLVEVRSRRVGGATYQVPMEVRADRSHALAIRWLIGSARDRGEKSMQQRLASEFMDASQGRGNAIKKKDETHRMAEANRAFAHYRW